MAEHLIITGRVQGVGFRAFAKDAADALGLSGWVRNREDGSVEAVVEGDIDAFVSRLKDGPPAGRVDEIERTDTAQTPETGFEIRG